jgi:hypothetical protein
MDFYLVKNKHIFSKVHFILKKNMIYFENLQVCFK